jgi:lipid-A-disaccharide synthase
MEPKGEAQATQDKAPGSTPRTRRRRVMIVAGEASGDLHGADLAAQILSRASDCELCGIAGERMRAAGVRALFRTEDIAGLGFMELASTIRRTLAALRSLRRALVASEKPDLLILIDYPEFNMRLARAAKRAGVPVLYYIVPQVWAWRRGRIAKLIRWTDRLAVVFPFEAQLYAGAGNRVAFVGHPLLDRVAPAQGRTETLARHGFPTDARLLAILPGSRPGEIRYLLKPMLAGALTLARKHGLTPCIALAPTLSAGQLGDGREARKDGIRVIEGDTYSIIAASELALVSSGTATLETALLGCPMVIAYKVSPITYGLARMLVTGVDFFGMPNILAERLVVPELLQGQVTESNLVRAAEPMLVEPHRTETIAALKALRARLGTPGAAQRVALLALEMMG